MKASKNSAYAKFDFKSICYVIMIIHGIPFASPGIYLDIRIPSCSSCSILKNNFEPTN